MDCLFCKIIKGDIPSYKVYEEEKVLVFLDISPKANGHLLIIPKEHFKDIDDIDSLNYMLDVIRQMKNLLEKVLGIDGLTIIQNNGSAQDVKHFHIHLVPCYKFENPLKDVKDIYEILKKAL
jgi:histidine triad (HIT) family protein